ncbi:MAG UNVERIFIED_CONTAM: formate dehydrogenase accessory sulfurtransferase FdhD [Anaerolineae bacterium]
MDEAVGCVNVQLKTRNVHLRRQMILTSGCGGGMTFQQLLPSVGALRRSSPPPPTSSLDRLEELRDAATLYNKVRGVHTAVLCSETESLYAAEDVGRHDTVDKIAGKVVKDGFDPGNCILITSGRISSEMIGKANRMNIAVVVSRTAPTSISVQLAEVWEICLVGYARRDAMRIYTHPERLGLK